MSVSGSNQFRDSLESRSDLLLENTPEQVDLASKLHQHVKDISLENFDKCFKVGNAIEFFKKQGSPEDLNDASLLEEAQNYLSSIGESELMEEKNPETFKARLLTVLEREGANSRMQTLISAHDKYLHLNEVARKVVYYREKLDTQRKTKQETTGGLLEGLDNLFETGGLLRFIRKIKRNLDEAHPINVLAAAGSVIAISLIVSKPSENKGIQWVKQSIKRIAGIFGIATLVNAGFEGVTGESAYDKLKDTFSDWGKPDFLQKTLECKEREALNFGESLIYMGHVRFDENLLNKYKRAKSLYEKSNDPGDAKLELPGVDKNKFPPQKIFAALDTFVKHYPKASQELAQKKLLWAEAVPIAFAADGKLGDIQGKFDKAKDFAKEMGTKGWNFLRREGFGTLKEYYLKYFGKKDASDQEVTAWFENSHNDVSSKSELISFFEKKFGLEKASSLKKVLQEGSIYGDKHSIRSLDAGEYTYVISESPIETFKGDERIISDAWKNAEANASEFFVQLNKNQSERYLPEHIATLRIIDESSLMVFYRVRRTPHKDSDSDGLVVV